MSAETAPVAAGGQAEERQPPEGVVARCPRLSCPRLSRLLSSEPLVGASRGSSRRSLSSWLRRCPLRASWRGALRGLPVDRCPRGEEPSPLAPRLKTLLSPERSGLLEVSGPSLPPGGLSRTHEPATAAGGHGGLPALRAWPASRGPTVTDPVSGPPYSQLV